jgi:transcription-repair coupling factor (superfamily II helicase)
VNPGMEGSMLKIMIKTKEYDTAQWLHVVREMVKGIPLAKKDQGNPVN